MVTKSRVRDVSDPRGPVIDSLLWMMDLLPSSLLDISVWGSRKRIQETQLSQRDCTTLYVIQVCHKMLRQCLTAPFKQIHHDRPIIQLYAYISEEFRLAAALFGMPVSEPKVSAVVSVIGTSY